MNIAFKDNDKHVANMRFPSAWRYLNINLQVACKTQLPQNLELTVNYIYLKPDSKKFCSWFEWSVQL